MPTIQPPGNGPWRTPGEHQPRVAVHHDPRRRTYELTITPGAGAHELAQAAAGLPEAAYTGHRRHAPAGPGVVLVFQATPAEPAGVPARTSPRGGAPGRVPATRAAVADLPVATCDTMPWKVFTVGGHQAHRPHPARPVAHPGGPGAGAASARRARRATSTAARRAGWPGSGPGTATARAA